MSGKVCLQSACTWRMSAQWGANVIQTTIINRLEQKLKLMKTSSVICETRSMKNQSTKSQNKHKVNKDHVIEIYIFISFRLCERKIQSNFGSTWPFISSSVETSVPVWSYSLYKWWCWWPLMIGFIQLVVRPYTTWLSDLDYWDHSLSEAVFEAENWPL